MILSILAFSTAQSSHSRPKYGCLYTRLIESFGTKTPYTLWHVEVTHDIQARFPYSPHRKRKFLSTQPYSPHQKKEVLINQSRLLLLSGWLLVPFNWRLNILSCIWCRYTFQHFRASAQT